MTKKQVLKLVGGMKPGVGGYAYTMSAAPLLLVLAILGASLRELPGVPQVAAPVGSDLAGNRDAMTSFLEYMASPEGNVYWKVGLAPGPLRACQVLINRYTPRPKAEEIAA